MNIYWRIIPFFLLVLTLGNSKICLAAEPEVRIGSEAVWESEEEGIAKVTFQETDVSATEVSLGRTDYIFMVDGSRTTTLDDYYLRENNQSETEPLQAHCPCMKEGHYYKIDTREILPITHTLGYLRGTERLISWSAERKIWSDSAKAHFNERNQQIPVRYSSGCKDIFTLFKDVTVETIRQIAERQDGSRVAFLSYSAADGTLYGLTEYTADYEKAISEVQSAGYLPGSCVAPAIRYAKKMIDSNASATKIFLMGDGQQSDIAQGIEEAAALRAMPKVYLYTACMGIQTYSKDTGYEAMRSMAGADNRFFSMIRTAKQTLLQSFMTMEQEKTERTVAAAEKSYTWTVPEELWDCTELTEYRDRVSAGTLEKSGNSYLWSIPEDSSQETCTIYLRLNDSARYVSEKTEYLPAQKLRCSYEISGGSLDGTMRSVSGSVNSLSVEPSKLELSEILIASGKVSKKKERTYYVKGGSDTVLTFSSETRYPTELWKPEENQLREDCANGYRNYPTADENQRSEDFAILSSWFEVQLTRDKETRTYHPRGMIGAAEGKQWYLSEDPLKSLTLICDAKGPDITGTFQEKITENTNCSFRVSDDGSGVLEKSFRLTLKNKETGKTKSFQASGNLLTCVLGPEDESFRGVIEWELTAEDRVGNRTVKNGSILIREPKTEEEMLREVRTRIL